MSDAVKALFDVHKAPFKVQLVLSLATGLPLIPLVDTWLGVSKALGPWKGLMGLVFLFSTALVLVNSVSWLFEKRRAGKVEAAKMLKREKAAALVLSMTEIERKLLVTAYQNQGNLSKACEIALRNTTEPISLKEARAAMESLSDVGLVEVQHTLMDGRVNVLSDLAWTGVGLLVTRSQESHAEKALTRASRKPSPRQ